MTNSSTNTVLKPARRREAGGWTRAAPRGSNDRTAASPLNAYPNLALFAANRAKIIGYLRALGAADHAEDLAHETWLRIARRPETEPLTVSYLMRVAHNLFIDHIRSDRQRRRREDVYQHDGPDGGEIDHAPDTVRVLLSRERLARLDAALQALGPRTETIVRRHRIEGISHRTLAQEFGISVSAIEKQLQKAYRVITLIQIEQDEDTGGRRHAR